MTGRTFDRNAAIVNASQRLMAREIAASPHNADAIRKQVAASTDALQGKEHNRADCRFIVEIESAVKDAQDTFHDPFAQAERDIAAQHASTAPAAIPLGPNYASEYAAAKGIDHIAQQPFFAAMAQEKESAAVAAIVAGRHDAAARYGRQAHHAALLAGTKPSEDVLTLSRGLVASDDDWN